jgi:predicted PurR-regulated permease PerM
MRSRPRSADPLDEDFSDLKFFRSGEDSHATGPLVWIAVIATTCLLLVVFQKILWLVVPFLLALILFYLLSPLMTNLVRAGASCDAAALIVSGAFFALMCGLLMVALPWMALRLSEKQALIEHYVSAGSALLQQSVLALEQRFGLLAQAHISRSLGERMQHMTGAVAEQVEPVVLGIAAWGPSLLLVPVLVYFFLKDGRHLKLFLSRAVPNAFFETTLYLLHEIDQAGRAYFQGLLRLTLLDTITLALGLWLIGMPMALLLGLIAAVLAWIPYVGSIAGGLRVVLVAAADFPGDPGMAYSAIGLFIAVRLLDDFVYMPITIGKSLRLHPLITVLMILVGGAVGGISGLMLVLPILGVVLVIGKTIGIMLTDPRLMARFHHGRALRKREASADLKLD